jgi:hypothetical protein
VKSAYVPPLQNYFNERLIGKMHCVHSIKDILNKRNLWDEGTYYQDYCLTNLGRDQPVVKAFSSLKF